MPGADNGDFTPFVFLFMDSLATDWNTHRRVLTAAKVFVCGIQLSTPGISECSQRTHHLISGFLPLDCHAHINDQIEHARALLRGRQQMIDYPTSY
jgi:hypothetical protein